MCMQLLQIPTTAMIEVRATHVAQVRGFEVELYSRQQCKTRSGRSIDGALRIIDVGEWRVGGYVRWTLERHQPDFWLLDEVDELLRAFFPPGAGTVHRADQPVSTPSVRLSSVR